MANFLSTLLGWLGGPRARTRSFAADGADARADADVALADDDNANTVPAEALRASATESDAPDSATSGTAGWYGKMPALGDFASRRLPEEFVAKWDTWLSEGIETAAASLDARWDDVWRAAPPWRFLLTPGVIDERLWIGVMVASVDRVGRQFPLTIVLPNAAAPMPIAALEVWWEGALAAVRACSDEGATVDGFEEALARLGAPAFAVPPATDPHGVLLRSNAADGFAPAFGNAAALMLQSASGFSLWWPAVTDATPPVVVMRGLPRAGAFAALLEGLL